MTWSSVTGVVSAASISAESENPLLPATYDIIWGGLSFLIIFVLFWKYVMPRLREILAERSAQIEGGMAKAEQMQVEAKTALDSYVAQLAQARTEAATIREKAQAEKAAIIDEARKEAGEAAAAIAVNAQAQIQAEKAKAIADLRRESGAVAVDLAEKIIGESLDPQKTAAIIDRFIGELESGARAVQA